MGRRSSEIDPYIKAAEAEGWTVETSSGSHICFTPADRDQRKIFTGRTPSDVRSLRNLRSQLRRAGLKGV